jgi:hypothetical protein
MVVVDGFLVLAGVWFVLPRGYRVLIGWALQGLALALMCLFAAVLVPPVLLRLPPVLPFAVGVYYAIESLVNAPDREVAAARSIGMLATLTAMALVVEWLLLGPLHPQLAGVLVVAAAAVRAEQRLRYHARPWEPSAVLHSRAWRSSPPATPAPSPPRPPPPVVGP